MSWIDSLLEFTGFKEPDRSQEAQTTVRTSGTTVPDYLDEFAREQIQLVDQLSQQAYRPPSVSGVSPFTPGQVGALGRAEEYYGAPGGTEAGIAASGALQNLTGLAGQRITDPGALTPFMNPYLDALGGEIDRAAQQAQIAADARAMGSQGYSAFGGNRRGIVEGQIADSVIRQKADLQRQAFDRAVPNYFKDLAARGVAAESALGGATNLAALTGRELGAGLTYGGAQQAQNQAQLSDLLRTEKAEINWPFQMADVRQGALANLPYGKTVTEATDVFGGPGGYTPMTGLGNIASIASGIGNFFATPSGTGAQSPAQGWGNLWDTAKGWMTG